MALPCCRKTRRGRQKKENKISNEKKKNKKSIEKEKIRGRKNSGKMHVFSIKSMPYLPILI